VPRQDDDDDYTPPAGGELLKPRRKNEFRRRKPGLCLNHDEVATEQTCADCKEWFCPNCVVAMQGKVLCGPCKNFRLRGFNRPPRPPTLALVALLTGLVAGPVSFCLPTFGAVASQASLGWTIALAVVGLLLPCAGLFLSGWALRQIDTRPNLGGRGLALTGATASLVGVLWCLTVVFLVVFKQTQG
jgi:hypothetical protein